jgi:hypothetical protein
VLEPTRADAALTADVVVGIRSERDRAAAGEVALAVQAGLRAAFPDRTALALVLTPDPEGTVQPGGAIPLGDPGAPAPAIHTGGAGPEAALHTLLDVALSVGAPACALLEPVVRPSDPAWLRAILDPVLQGSADLVAPTYSRRRFERLLVTAFVYPLTRALFGQRLTQPLGRELVLSRRLAEHLSRDDAWRTDPAHAGADLWVITKALVRECRCAQVFLGRSPLPPPPQADVSDALARVLGLLFHEMELHAARWQRVRGSCSVATFGEEILAGDTAHPPLPAPLVAAFALGWQDLRGLWARALPPQALLALQRIPREPPESFRLPDALWARIVFDFAVAWRIKTMDRVQLLRSLTPIYMGWIASYVNEVAPLDGPGIDARNERLCAAFEAEKPYLISRWRWPDRFMP